MIEQWTDTDKLMQWLSLSHFRITEAWGDPDKMHPLLIFIIEQFRSKLPNGCWIKIHCGYKDGGHTKNSFHYKGRAIDFHIVGCSLLEAERHLIKFLKKPLIINKREVRLIDFIGLGIYPDWNDPGFHLDIRGTKASWSRIKGSYVAYELGLEKIRELSL